MAIFHPGQLVKKVRHPHWITVANYNRPETIPLGSVCRVLRLHTTAPDADIFVDWNGIGLGSRQYCFEPIQYDGNKAISWSECICNPDGTHKWTTIGETA